MNPAPTQPQTQSQSQSPVDVIVNRLGVEVANHAVTQARLAEALAKLAAMEASAAPVAPVPAGAPPDVEVR